MIPAASDDRNKPRAAAPLDELNPVYNSLVEKRTPSCYLTMCQQNADKETEERKQIEGKADERYTRRRNKK